MFFAWLTQQADGLIRRLRFWHHHCACRSNLSASPGRLPKRVEAGVCAAELFTYIGFFEQSKARVFFANTWPRAAALLGCALARRFEFCAGSLHPGPRGGASEWGSDRAAAGAPASPPCSQEERGWATGPWPRSPWGSAQPQAALLSLPGPSALWGIPSSSQTFG